MRLAKLFLIPVCGFAQPANLQIVSVSAQQAIVSYDAPDTNPCTLAVTDNSSLPVTVWDVSNAKFANSASDLGRANTITWKGSLKREVVIGSRLAQLGSDGKLYSRSLQANTAHQLTVTCTGGAARLAFQTRNIQAGSMAPDPVTYNPSGFRGAGWPSMDWTNKNAIYIDPKSGAAMKPSKWFNQAQISDTAQKLAYYYQASGTWTSAASVLSGSGSTLATSTTTDPIFVAININEGGVGGASNFSGGKSIADLRLNLTGNGNGAARQVSFCISADSGQTCISSIQTVTLPASTATVAFPAAGSLMVAPFSEWGISKWPTHNLVFPWSTNVNTSGTAVNSTNSFPNYYGNGFFPMELPAGSKVFLSGSSCANSLCTAASVTNALTMTLSENVGTLSNAQMVAANFGFKIWQTSSGGTVKLTATYDTAIEDTPNFAIPDGASNQCSNNTITVTRTSSGATVPSYPVYLCHLETSNNMAVIVYAYNPANGDFWPVGSLFSLYGNGLGSYTPLGSATNMFDPNDGHTLYGLSTDQATSHRPVLARVVYRGNGTPYTTGPITNGSWSSPPNGQKASGTSCNSGEQTSGNMCLSVLTDINAGHDLQTQMASKSKLGSLGVLGYPSAVGVFGNYFVMDWQTNGQDTVGAFSYTNLATGNMDYTSDTMFGAASGGAMHTAGGWNIGNRYHGVAINPLGAKNPGPWGGPYKSQVIGVWQSSNGTSGTWVGTCSGCTSGSTGLTTLNYPCPAGTCQTAAVNDTVRIRVAGQLCNAAANAAESSAFPCPWNSAYSNLVPLAVGQTVGDAGVISNITESFSVLRVAQNSTTDLDVWLQRQSYSTPAASYTNGWSLALLPTSGCGSTTFWFDTTGPSNILFNSCHTFSHQDWGAGPPGTYNYLGGPLALYAQPNNANGVSPSVRPYNIGGWGSWQGFQGFNGSGYQPSSGLGAVGWVGSGQVESYPSCRQWKAPASEQIWCLDFRPYQGGNFTINGAGTNIGGITITPVTAGGRTHVYRVGPLAPLHPKVLPIESWAGGFLFKDVSNASANSFTDASGNFTFCQANAANECVTGSTPGSLYYNSANTLNSLGVYYSNNIEVAAPALMPASPIAPWGVQTDITRPDPWDRYYRRMTMCLNGPSRNYTATNWRSTPEGAWAFCVVQYADGVFPMLMMVKLPPWPGYDSNRRDGFVNMPVTLGGGAALAEVRFGYEENGSTGQFYCTSRGEPCMTIASGATSVSPYNFLSEGHRGATCVSGCTVNIPAISGRIVWWQEFRSSDGGATWTAQGQPQPAMVP